MAASSNAAEIAAALGKLATSGGLAGAERSLLRAGSLVSTAIKAHASGRPGPRAPTGDYRRAINTRKIQATATGAVVSVGTNRPQAQRLEYGFSGTDSRGRHYNQPAYPHFEPGLAAAEGPAMSLLEKELLDDLKF